MTKLVVQSPLIEHRLLGNSMWQMVFAAPEIAKQATPGQFVNICIPDRDQPFLRRPLSLADVDKAAGMITLIYRIVGEGTRRLSTLKAGDIIDCMGPLGSGFKMDAKKPLLIGGGMGIVPLIYLARSLCDRPVEILLGGRNKEEMFWPDLFATTCKKIHVTTDDGSVGTKGFTVNLLPKILEEGDFDAIYTCGPHVMMEGIAKIAAAHKVACQVSLEAHMACGVGACLSCTFEGTDGHRRKVCVDGPVFDATEVFQ